MPTLCRSSISLSDGSIDTSTAERPHVGRSESIVCISRTCDVLVPTYVIYIYIIVYMYISIYMSISCWSSTDLSLDTVAVFQTEPAAMYVQSVDVMSDHFGE